MRMLKSNEFFTDVTNTCESFTSMKDWHVIFTSVIRTHDMCDKFIKKRVFIMRSHSEGNILTKFKKIRPVVLEEMR